MNATVRPSTTPVSDETLRGFSGYSMKRAFNAIQADINAALKPLDLRMLSFSALVTIVDNPGLRQSQLAEALSIERPNLVAVIDELVRRDLITRDPSPTDRRAYALHSTQAGRQLYDQAVKVVQAHETRMTHALPPPERVALIRALRKIETTTSEPSP